MNKIEFENGNVIESIDTKNNNIRGERSKLVSFYCRYCGCFHIDYPVKDITVIDDDIYCNKIIKNI